MSAKPIDEAVRALRELRETGDVSDWHAMERALDAGIAALTAAQQQGQAVAWHVIHDDGGSHVMLADTVDDAFRAALASNGRRVRPLIYGDTAPPPSAPVGVEAERAFFAQDFYEEAREGKKPWPAQQPAAVDGAMLERVASALDHWDGSDHDSDYYDELARVAVEAVFAAQPGGSDNE